MNLLTLKNGDILWCKGVPSVVITKSAACISHSTGKFTALVVVYNRGKIKELTFQGVEEDVWEGCDYKGTALMCDETSVKSRTLWENVPITLFDKMIEEEVYGTPLCKLIANIMSITADAVDKHNYTDSVSCLKQLIELFQKENPNIDMSACIAELPDHLRDIVLAVNWSNSEEQY